MCDINIEGKTDVRQKYSKWTWRKKSRLTGSIVIKLPVKLLKLKNYETIKTSTKELKPSISAAFQSDLIFY